MVEYVELKEKKKVTIQYTPNMYNALNVIITYTINFNILIMTLLYYDSIVIKLISIFLLQRYFVGAIVKRMNFNGTFFISITLLVLNLINFKLFSIINIYSILTLIINLKYLYGLQKQLKDGTSNKES